MWQCGDTELMSFEDSNRRTQNESNWDSHVGAVNQSDMCGTDIFDMFVTWILMLETSFLF